ncbi:nitrate- and nitrite sensing domain-containing protein [Nocardiopsis ganjiahuensis]|uniref:nitrate- and nitrite sensing domain-containing protein n=1 Tax=Nocardiopsis ganjiahuensis TaxID=239984 RepID=UPI00034AA1E8|nr:nitrate- and nitrite sensing domain-containing protein [Nocardiopsis ganjiahuensis]
MPHEKRSSLRARMITLVLIPSTALLALWAVFTTVLATDIRDLSTTTALIEEVGEPVVDVISHLQRERRATMAAAHRPTAATTEQLDTAQQETDEAVQTLVLVLDRHDHTDLPPEVLDLQRQLHLLDRHRTEVVDPLPSGADPLQVASAPYTRMINSGLEIWEGQADRADAALSSHLRSLASILRTREFLSQQDNVLAYSLATNSFTPEAHIQFAAAAGAQRHTWDQVEPANGSRRSSDYTTLTGSSQMRSVHHLQDLVIASPGGPDSRVPLSSQTWNEASRTLDERMRELELGRMAQIVELGHTQTRDLFGGALLISIVALVAALTSVLVAVTGSQRLGHRLQALRTHTLHHARIRLPQVTARLRAGQSVDVDAETPRLAQDHHDELGQVAEAFNDAQRAAVVAAVEEAQVRAGVRNMFRNIARRTQSLVHRQLSLLDRLERTETDPEVLESLFRIDHFSTQMRRNAENLMLLSGDRPTRRGAASVGLHEAVRAAAGQIEDYARVRVLALPQVALPGEAGSDLVRLVAELLENAAAFSPPGTEVTVGGHTPEGGGHVVEVQDRGLGMTADQLETANTLLADPPRFDLGQMREDSQLGLYVVATIASRHGFEVELHALPYQGTRALVRIPDEAVQHTGHTGPLRRAELLGPPRASDDSTAPSPTANPHADTPPDPDGNAVLTERARPGRHRSQAPRPHGDPPHPESPAPPAQPWFAEPAGEEVPGGPAPSPATGRTYKGLPRRQRRPVDPPTAPGTGGPQGTGAHETQTTGSQRSLSEIRSMMSAFQAGTERGRAESAGTEDTEGAPEQQAHHDESSEG